MKVIVKRYKLSVSTYIIIYINDDSDLLQKDIDDKEAKLDI